MTHPISDSLSIQTHLSFDFSEEDTAEAFLSKYLGKNSRFEIREELPSFSNRNSVIREELTGRQWVLRTPHAVSNFLSDRNQEQEALLWAKREGLSLLDVIGCDPSSGYLLTQFLVGKSGTSGDFKKEESLTKALALLHRLHSSPTAPITRAFEPLSRLHVTVQVAEKIGYHLPDEVSQIGSQLKNLWSRIPTPCFSSVPCHNDPSPENFFFQKEDLYLHDWELASLNDPIWDLTHFSLLAQVDFEKTLELYPISDLTALDKMVFFKPFILFNTVVWASLERQYPLSLLPKETIETLYHTFLKQITESMKSELFQSSFQKLLQEGQS